MELTGKTAIITGSGSGIGRALAREFARNGANVVCAARRKDRLEETVQLIESESGVALAVPTDITCQDQVQGLVQTVRNEFGAVDILFNNAGSFASIAGVHELDMETWWHDITVNLYGATLCVREVLPHMMERDAGVIINMNGGRPVGGTGYACGKAGLMELTRILAEELNMANSRVIVVGAGPGLVRTEMTNFQARSEAGQRWIPSTKQAFEEDRTRNPEDIARATIRMLKMVQPADRGKYYGPDTDFSEWQKNSGRST